MDCDEFITASADVLEPSDEEENICQHENLIKGVASLSSKKRIGTPRCEPTPRVSEFNIAACDGKVKLHELVSSLGQSSKSGQLKKQLSRVGKNQKVVQVPLSKHEQEQIHRMVGYEGATKEISKWDPVVHQNRKAKQLQFPLYQQDIRMPQTTEQFVKSHQPRSTLEQQVAAVLKDCRSVLPDRRPLSAAEELALKAKSVEEAAERRAELQKQRALLSYYGAKLKRQGKIKSKKYHRLKRKSRQKNEEKALEELKLKDPEVYQQKLRRAEMERLKERMSLKHKGTTRFMKRQTIYGKYDSQGRQAVQDMLQKGQELVIKKANFDSDDESYVDSQSDSDNDVPSTSISVNPWMSGKASKAKATKSKPNNKSEKGMDELSTETRTLTTHDESRSEPKKLSGYNSENDLNNDDTDIDCLFQVAADAAAADKKSSKAEASAVVESRDTVVVKKQTKHLEKQQVERDKKRPGAYLNKTSKKMRLREKTGVDDGSNDDSSNIEDDESEAEEDEDGEENCVAKLFGIQKTDAIKWKDSPMQAAAGANVMLDPKRFIGRESRINHILVPSLSEGVDGIDEEVDGGDIGEAAIQRRVTLAEAFADDNVVEEFAAEKKSIEERDKPKDIDLTLPGWGDWAGPGVQASKGKRKRFVVKAPEGPPRKDHHLPDVIISELKDESIAKLQVNSLPFPYKNIHQFQDSIKKTIGPTSNSVSVFKTNIKPKLVTRMGTIIEPISKVETFQKQQIKRPQFTATNQNSNARQRTGQRSANYKTRRN